MAVFGRFDVFYPDGRVETYPLDGDTVSVGRSEGNTIALDTDTISRYHFSVTNKDGVIQLTDLDSANGTYIDGTQLKSNEPYLLEDIEEIQIGHLRIIYHPGSDSPTIPVAILEESTQPSDVGFRVSIEMSHVDVWPASSSSVEIAVTNSVDEEKQFQVVASGLPDGWLKINRPNMMIDGLDTTYILVNIKPSRRADVPPKDYTVEIRVSPVNEPEKFIQIDLTVSLKGFGGFGMALSPEVIHSDDDIHLYMLNQGNETLTVTVTGHDSTNQLNFELPSGKVQLAAGQRTQVTGKVQPQKRPLFGKAVDIPFAMVVKAHTDSAYVAAVPGIVHVEPSLANWMVGTMAGIAIAIVLIIMTQVFGTPEPKIQDLELSAQQVAQGTSVDLSWTASDAQKFVIEVDRLSIAELPADQTYFSLTTDNYSDSIEIAVIAVNGEQTAVAQQQLDIYVPAIINSFEIDRLELVRNVSSTLVLTWNISGAVSTNLTYPAEFKPTHPDSTYGAEDNEVLIGVPQNDFKITLSVTDEIGTVTEQSFDITTGEPECTPTQDTLLFEGPDSQFPEVEVAVVNVPVIVNGIDKNKQWIHVELASGDDGWGFKASFECEGFDPDYLVTMTDIPVLPTVNPTLPPTPTNIPTQTLTPKPTLIPNATATKGP